MLLKKHLGGRNETKSFVYSVSTLDSHFAHCLAGSMESNLAGSWIGADGSTATYAKVKGKEFSGVLSAALPYIWPPQNLAPVGCNENQQPVMRLSSVTELHPLRGVVEVTGERGRPPSCTISQALNTEEPE